MSSRLHPFARLVIAAVGLFAAQIAAGLALAAVYVGVKLAQTPGQPVDKIIGDVAKVSETNSLILTLFVYPIGLLWLGFCRAKLDKRSFVSLGLRRSRATSNALRGLAAGFLAVAVIWAILWVTGAISVNGWSQAARSPTVALSLLGWLIAFAAVGFFEEFTFRGYALHNLTDWLGWKAAVLVQATVFALIHLTNVAAASNEARLAALGAMPGIFLVGAFFALSYRKTGSLWFPIGFHAAWNFSLGCLFSLPVSGLQTFRLLDVKSNTQSWLSGGSFGAEGSFLLLPVLLALIWFMWQAPDHPQALLDLELIESVPPAEPVIASQPALVAEEIEDDPNRENRFRTKFGTSEGFDERMLRELRQLQNEREAAEAQRRRESAVQTAVIDVELLKPPVEQTPVELENLVAAEAPAEIETAVEQPKVEPVKVEAVPVETAVEEQETPTPVVVKSPAAEPAPVPVKKKSLPKW